MQFLAKGAIYRLLFMGFNFLIGLLIARISDVQEYGIITLMITNGAVFHIVAGLGTDQALVWHGAGKAFDSNKLFTFTLLSAIIELLLFIIVSVIFRQTTDKSLLSGQSGSFFYYELIYFTGVMALDKYSSLMYANHQAVPANRFLTLSTLTLLIVLVLTIISGNTYLYTPLQLYCLLIFAQAISIMIFYHIKNAKLQFSFFSKENLRSFFNFSILVFFTNLIQFIAYRLDYWLIDYYRGPDALGVYAQAGRFAQLLWVLPNILAALAAPALLSPQKNYGEKQISDLLRKLNLYNLILIFLITGGALFLYTFFLPYYSAGFKALLLMIPGFYFFCTVLLVATFFSAKRMLWINFAGSVFCLILILITDLLLIPWLGINGAAIANTISYLGSALFNIYFFTKYTGVRFSDLFRFSSEDWRWPGNKLAS